MNWMTEESEKCTKVNLLFNQMSSEGLDASPSGNGPAPAWRGPASSAGQGLQARPACREFVPCSMVHALSEAIWVGMSSPCFDELLASS